MSFCNCTQRLAGNSASAAGADPENASKPVAMTRSTQARRFVFITRFPKSIELHLPCGRQSCRQFSEPKDHSIKHTAFHLGDLLHREPAAEQVSAAPEVLGGRLGPGTAAG